MEIIFLIENSRNIANQLKTSNFKKFRFLHTLSNLPKDISNSNTVFILDFSKVLNFSKEENLTLDALVNLNYNIIYLYDTKYNFDINKYKINSNIQFMSKSILQKSNFLDTLKEILSKEGYLYNYHTLELNFKNKSLLINKQKIDLTSLEYDLLEYLILNKNKVLSRKTLFKEVWGYSFLGSSRTIDTHIKSLRKKIHPYRNLIKTVWGKGYIFKD